MYPKIQPSYDAIREIDIGKKQRRMYFIGCSIGSFISVYVRRVITLQESTGFNDCISKFEKPWFFTILMSLGMSFGLAVHKIILLFQSKDSIVNVSFSHVDPKCYLLAFIPALGDIFYSVGFTFSIVTNGHSFAVALRFFDILFIPIIRCFYLRKKMLPYSTIAIALLTIGIFMVSGSYLWDFIKENDGNTINVKNAFAAIFQIFSQAVFAVKVITEEKLLHQNDLPPLILCGIEGLYEVVIVVFCCCTVLYFIPSSANVFNTENLCDTFLMVIHSKPLIAFVVVYPFVSLIFNNCAMGIIMMENAVAFTVNETIVTSFVWFCDIFIYYVIKNYTIGSQWRYSSILHLVGIIFIIFGALLYTKAIRLPHFKYETANVVVIKIEEGHHSI
ncbi:hypothetical protein TRFO_30040 [Tritrichomonas foetus]|uniref:Integral membrane protein n=1 Tax=Tritrichomonas foetus TaxID=1144522 RepID=A0A1J4JZQ0_9EUKA|nr:hypothetical protein TRFO_30040 [Tritrichomonas foetus]|eukprot:OHT02733.1 hypothetical protein TRFO_30040 [Tritrichomonas foetus]